MNRKRFMAELEKLLWDLPYNERKEAIQYYNDYFDDAGEEKEAQVIEELGSPEQVARTIREGMFENGGEYTEHGYEDSRFRDRQEVSAGPSVSPAPKTKPKKQKNTNPWKIFCIILLCILLFPIIVPVGLALLVAAVVLLVGVIALVLGAGAAGIAIIVAGIGTIILGIVRLVTFPAVGAALGGIGCLLLALGILACLLLLWIFCKIIPPVVRGVVSLIRYPFRKAGILK